MERKEDDVDISFLPVVPKTIKVQSEQVEVTSPDISPPKITDKPTFIPKPNTQDADFDFKAYVQCLPFKLNLGDETNMTDIQQSPFIDIIYHHPEVFSLHDEDLGFCYQIRHAILTTMDRPGYLPHCTIPLQLEGEVQKCFVMSGRL